MDSWTDKMKGVAQLLTGECRVLAGNDLFLLTAGAVVVTQLELRPGHSGIHNDQLEEKHGMATGCACLVARVVMYCAPADTVAVYR